MKTAVAKLNPGIETLRVVGLTLVVWQHVCSLFDRDYLNWFGDLNVGQVGVAIFLAVSGFVVAHSSRSTRDWILARLHRIYPAYWIAISASLVAAHLVGSKSVTWQLFLAQLLGVGWFTHGGEIVNGPTWFISLLLACYAMAAVIYALPARRWTSLILALILIALSVRHFNSFLSARLATFILGFALGSVNSGSARMATILSAIGVQAILAATCEWQLVYGACGIAALGGGTALRRIGPGAAWIANVSYCIYLVHGPILYGVARLVPRNIIVAVGLGIPLSVLAALILSEIAERLDAVIVESRRRVIRYQAGAR